jgi:hypothetical protein
MNEMCRACNTYEGKERCIHGFGEKLEGRKPHERPRCRWEDNNKMDLREMVWEDMDWIDLAQDGDKRQALANVSEPSCSTKCREFID